MFSSDIMDGEIIVAASFARLLQHIRSACLLICVTEVPPSRATHIMSQSTSLADNPDIRSNITLCGIVAVLVSWCIDKSSLNRCVYFAAVVAVSAVCASCWEQLQYGAAVAVHLTNVAVIVVACLRRGKPLSADERVLERGDWAFRLLPVVVLAFLAASGFAAGVFLVGILFLAVSIFYAWKVCGKFIEDAGRRKVARRRTIIGICLLVIVLGLLMLA